MIYHKFQIKVQQLLINKRGLLIQTVNNNNPLKM